MAYVDDVERARAGDGEAFERLIRRFGGAARGMARSWSTDAEDAEDAAQDAFLDAYRLLDTLREPGAFPAWLLRIVRKHCDRRTRRAPRTRATSEASIPPVAPDSEARLEAAETVSKGLGRLPEHERIVVALHHLGDLPLKDVAALLELKPETVRQRLARARRRLGEAEGAPELPPTELLEDRVQLFLAIRQGDSDRVQGILHRRPDLLEAHESWTDEAALASGLVLAHRRTPLLTAAERGSLRLVDLLLRAGASVDGRCGCDAGETPLFAAAVRGHAPVVERLLAAGASPSAAPGEASALEVAERRGHRHVAERLRRALDADGRPALESPCVARLEGERIWTGIAAVDLLAPLRLGRSFCVHGAAETGLMVLLAEVTLRLSKAGMPARWLTWPRQGWQVGEYAQVAAQYGLPVVVEELSGSADERAHALRDASGLRVLFPEPGREAEAEAALATPVPPDGLTLYVKPWASVTQGMAAPSCGGLWQGVWVTDPELAREGIYPALSLTASEAEVDEDWEPLRARVRAAAHRESVRRSLAQPFEVMHHRTGRPGRFVTAAELGPRFERALREPHGASSEQPHLR